ncbi:MFS transporter [Jeotgalibacillus sp. R-1-5s-1]|uniref:MFS transporter n=1 Tax=Jeotgalibacillus sp. R-1-5s-1 TaxID=2555897 RepID=UPI0010693329|nr:MFS transporter [Jeotgalibacillus sp. R-1-5s-1]TFD94469.1 MFS transporter [Jeotgalibacillus sp. R-1-5s-1]
MSLIRHGTPLFRKTSFAFFAAGFNTFAILYSTQPLLPVFSEEFKVSPAISSLSLSITTIILAISLIIFGSLSEVWGRKPVMSISMVASSVLCILAAFSPDFTTLLVFRTLLGITLAGLPAIAMAYLGEEMDARSLGVAMGLYISGNAIGGVFGRVFSGIVADWLNWQFAMAAIGVLGLISAIIFTLNLRSSEQFGSEAMHAGTLVSSMVSHLKDPGLRYLFGIGFIIMAGNVAIFNYMGYALTEPPYNLSQALVSWLFIVMIIGMYSSIWAGRRVEKFGRQKMLLISLLISFTGLLISLEGSLFSKVLALTLYAFGFFASQTVATSWVSARALQHKSQASSLYLFLYYVGSSIGGTLGGFFWSGFGWIGVAGMIAVFLMIGFWCARGLAKVERYRVAEVEAASAKENKHFGKS